MDFKRTTNVRLIKVVNRPCQHHRWDNMEIRIGDVDCKNKFKNKKIDVNTLCEISPRALNADDIFVNCHGVAGKYLTMQKTGPDVNGQHYMNIREVLININGMHHCK